MVRHHLCKVFYARSNRVRSTNFCRLSSKARVMSPYLIDISSSLIGDYINFRAMPRSVDCKSTVVKVIGSPTSSALLPLPTILCAIFSGRGIERIASYFVWVHVGVPITYTARAIFAPEPFIRWCPSLYLGQFGAIPNWGSINLIQLRVIATWCDDPTYWRAELTAVIMIAYYIAEGRLWWKTYRIASVRALQFHKGFVLRSANQEPQKHTNAKSTFGVVSYMRAVRLTNF